MIGVGNQLRGDDAAGLEVALRLRARMTDVEVVLHEGDGSGLLELWRRRRAVVLIDAVRSGARVGTLHRIDASAEPLPACLSAGSTHAIGVADAIELARGLDRLPYRVVLHGVEGACFETGAKLSDSVARAIPRLVAAAGREARALAGRPPGHREPAEPRQTITPRTA